LPHFLGDAGYAFGFNQADGEPSEPGDVCRTIANADAASILVKVSVNDVVAAIFNAPVPPVDL
jgi:hypothetical protein